MSQSKKDLENLKKRIFKILDELNPTDFLHNYSKGKKLHLLLLKDHTYRIWYEEEVDLSGQEKI